MSYILCLCYNFRLDSSREATRISAILSVYKPKAMILTSFIHIIINFHIFCIFLCDQNSRISSLFFSCGNSLQNSDHLQRIFHVNSSRRCKSLLHRNYSRFRKSSRIRSSYKPAVFPHNQRVFDLCSASNSRGGVLPR